MPNVMVYEYIVDGIQESTYEEAHVWACFKLQI